MKQIQKKVAMVLFSALTGICMIADSCLSQPVVYEASAFEISRSCGSDLETLNATKDESLFPNNYPRFLKEVYVLWRKTEQLRQLSPHDRAVFLKSQPESLRFFLRGILGKEKIDVRQLYSFARARVGEDALETFLKRFGIEPDNEGDLELEVSAQIERMRRRQAYCDFARRYTATNDNLARRIELVKSSNAPRELEYALRHCEEAEFERLLHIVTAKDGFGPKTSEDKALLDHLKRNRRRALSNNDKQAAMKWQAVTAQLVSQPVGLEPGDRRFSKSELFAMMRNAERTIQQRKRPFIAITRVEKLDDSTASSAFEIIPPVDVQAKPTLEQRVILFGFFDDEIVHELGQLKRIYEDILANHESGQTNKTKRSIRQKKDLLDVLEGGSLKASETQTVALHLLAKKILTNRDELHRRPFIRGIILLRWKEDLISYRFVEEFPMIVAGDTYPYQWKHDNEVNIALLLANVDPYEAAQAVRFIIYHGMWRGQEAKRLGLYGWLPQIIFGNRQTGKLPEFNNRKYYYCPDFRLRPTKKIDAENERNRTSEIMQLPFFGWTVWRVYEQLKTANNEHAVAFLKEVYPHVRANTEAIRTALDPCDEALLSGRDAWVNGMDNAWYHLMVMRRHLPERLIPKWAMETVEKHRVDNRVDKMPGNPVDQKLAKGRPSDYYYAFRFVFYDLLRDLELDPIMVYHASPYNSKDVAITSIMARSLEVQIAMANILKDTDADVHEMSKLRGRENEIVSGWNEEITRYRAHLHRMKKAVNRYLWSPEDKIYYNRDITQIFPGVAEQQYCHLSMNQQHQIRYEPRMEYWHLKKEGNNGPRYVLAPQYRHPLVIDQQFCSVVMDLNGIVNYEYKMTPEYWRWEEDGEGRRQLRLQVRRGDPFIVEQLCHLKRDQSGRIWYEPDGKYWTCLDSEPAGHNCRLNETAKRLMGRGARRIEDGDLLRSPAIAGFFPLFGHIPDDERAFQLAKQVVNPWMWWPEDGIPVPSQPMRILSTEGDYIPNPVYDPNKYWRGPTWMSATKPVMDGLRAYGYEMIYAYLVQLTASTLQDGRAVEHWRPENGEVNTSNINFPWAASCMAGSIWEELTEEERAEYLRLFHPRGHAEVHKLTSDKLCLLQPLHSSRNMVVKSGSGGRIPLRNIGLNPGAGRGKELSFKFDRNLPIEEDYRDSA